MCENLNWIRGMVDQVDRTELWKTVTWLTKNTPYRLAGSEQEKFAAEYVATRNKQFFIPQARLPVERHRIIHPHRARKHLIALPLFILIAYL